ncbi:MAG: TauD/TfdA family dioxygenase [Myxococcota bacterium]
MDSSIRIEPASPGCGAEVHGVDLARMDGDAWESVHRAFLDHGVVFFRDQKLGPDDHLALARRFGPIVVNKFFPESDANAQIAEVRKEPAQQTNIGGGWHTDHSYDEIPALGSILVARELPSQGGDTLFANMRAAYDALSDGLKATLRSLRAVHSNDHLYGDDGYYHKTDLAGLLKGKSLVGRAVHPVVIRHPDTDQPVLYVNPGHTRGFLGWSAEESLALLQFLYAHASSEAFTCRFRWTPGSVAIWDNRSTWHMALNDYQGERRLLHRITIEGVALRAA